MAQNGAGPQEAAQVVTQRALQLLGLKRGSGGDWRSMKWSPKLAMGMVCPLPNSNI